MGYFDGLASGIIKKGGFKVEVQRFINRSWASGE